MKQNTLVESQSRQEILPRALILLGIVACLGFAGWWLMAPRAVDVVLPARGLAIQAVYATGTVEARITIRVAPQVAGRIVELNADEGRAVKSGDILARLDDSDIRASVAELEARARYAEQQFQRTESLLKEGWATQDKFDQARSELDAARHAVRRAREQMTFMALRTPADGQIIRRDGEVGDFIPINQPVFYIAKRGVHLRISADVDEEDIPLVRAGQKVLIKADAFRNRVFDGEVSEVTPKGDPVARSYRVRIALPLDTELMIGMTAETNIVTAERQNALLVPASAVSGTVIWIVRDNRLERKSVQVGIKGRDRVEIASGLLDNDMVVVSPLQEFKPGQKVRARSAPPDTIAAGPAQGTAR